MATNIRFAGALTETAWETFPGARCAFEYGTAPAATNWTGLGEPVTAQAPSVLVLDTNAAAAGRVYRGLLLEP